MYIDIYQNKVGPKWARLWSPTRGRTRPSSMRSRGRGQKPFAATGVIANSYCRSRWVFHPFLASGFGPEGEWLRVVANGKDAATGQRVHNMVACTVCSCYPQALLGAQPIWYKSQQYRARSVRAPRGVIAEFAEAQGPAMVAKLKTYLASIDEVRVGSTAVLVGSPARLIMQTPCSA